MSCCKRNLSGLKAADFKKSIKGKKVALYTLKNNKGCEVSVSVGNHDTEDGTAIIGYGNFAAFVVFKNVKSGFFTFYALFKIGSFKPRQISFTATHIFNFIAFGYCLCGKQTTKDRGWPLFLLRKSPVFATLLQIK